MLLQITLLDKEAFKVLRVVIIDPFAQEPTLEVHIRGVAKSRAPLALLNQGLGGLFGGVVFSILQERALGDPEPDLVFAFVLVGVEGRRVLEAAFDVVLDREGWHGVAI